MGARPIAVDRGIADPAAWPGPVLDDAELARMAEQAVDVVDDDQVEIQEQDRPRQIVELPREAAELAPG